MSQLSVPSWDEDPSGVVAVFACTPDQVRKARRALPQAQLILVAHQGFSHKLPETPHTNRVVTFSESVRGFISQDIGQRPSLRHIKSVHLIRPHFQVSATWSWAPDTLWSMRSRPATRESIVNAGLDSLDSLCNGKIRIFGQEQVLGLIGPEQKQALRSRSSAYVTALHPRAGVGLAEHEAMAAGCPVVGFAWGDLLLARKRDTLAARQLHEFGDLYNCADTVNRVAQDEAFAEKVSACQADYIADVHSMENMDRTIAEFLASLESM